jgi:hypothetical protein
MGNAVILALSIAYLVCFQACAIPSIARIIRRGSSADLSVWREWLLVVGVTCQYMVMTLTGTSWYVRVSPILSLCSVGTLLWSIYRYRNRWTCKACGVQFKSELPEALCELCQVWN